MPGRSGWIRLAAVAALVGLVPLLSSCVALNSIAIGPQVDVVGDMQVTIRGCASGSAACPNGLSGAPALPGTGQVLLGIRVQDNVSLPSSFTSTGPEALAFSASPSYAAELERLAPAPAGSHWLGFISAVVDYSNTSGPQSFPAKFLYKLRRGADGSPFSGQFTTSLFIGGRMVTAAAPASRPVVCGPTLTALYDEDPSPATDVLGICEDSSVAATTVTHDLGVLGAPSASASPGDLATLPFTLRFAGSATPLADFRLSAASTLPGALFAVTPDSLIPATNGTSTALVAVGVPVRARAGTYDVTLTAKLGGQVRSAVGRLTVRSGTTLGGARLKLSAILPRRLSAKAARRRGIVVLIGATQAKSARVQLFQGRAKKAKVTKRVRLRVPGPRKVVLRSAKLVKGPYRVVIRADGRTFVRRATLAK
jgi:hypothetical protein